jgi:putative membrane protein
MGSDLWPYPPKGTRNRVEAVAGERLGLREVVTMMFGYGSHWAAWQVALMWVGMVVVLSLVVWAFYALVTGDERRPGRENRDDDARRILDQRLAKGGIDAQEYRRLGDLIAHDDAAPAGTGAER